MKGQLDLTRSIAVTNSLLETVPRMQKSLTIKRAQELSSAFNYTNRLNNSI